MKSLGRDARDHFRGHATPWERFADAKQPAGPRDGGEDRVGIERLDAAQIDHFDLDSAGRELLRDGQRLVDTRMLAAVRCAPPANKPTPAERDTCAPWLARAASARPTSTGSCPCSWVSWAC